MAFSDQFVIFISVFFTLQLIIKYLREKKRSTGGARNPPSLPCLPIIGSLPFLRQFNNISAFFMEKSYQLGPIFTFRVGNKLILVLNTKDVIEEALVKNSKYFSSRPEIYIDKFVNQNRKGMVFRETTPQWKRDHQAALIIMKEFGFGVKNIMEAQILNEIQAMKTFVLKKHGQPVDAPQLSVLVSSNIITNIIFGQRQDYALGISELITDIDRWIHNMDMVFDIAPFLKYIPPFNAKLQVVTECSNKIHASIETEITRSQENGVDCFVCSYIEKEGIDYDREQLNYLVRDLIGGGTETTSTTFQWMLIALANNPQIQRRLQDEIDSVIPRYRLPTIQDQSKLIYHQATILEIHRWRTLLSMSVARLTTDDCALQGYHIPSGTLVLPNLNAAHSNTTEWNDPDSFQPERFLDKDNRLVGKDRVIAFGLGRRSCFGEILARCQVFLILASVVQQFTVLPPEGQEKICDKPKLPVAITTKPEPFSVRFVERE